MTHSFLERRAFAAEHEPFWQAFYRSAFPDLLSAYPCPAGPSESQEQGIDRIVHLKSGKILKIEEKLREKDYGDIVLEFESGACQGWIEKDLACDYLAYGSLLPAPKGYLFPWPFLQQAWGKHQAEWKEKALLKKDGFYPVPGKNPSYISQAIAVPRRVLYDAMNRCSIIILPQELLKELPIREEGEL